MTKPAKKVQYKDYAEYLDSPKWEQVKQDYYENEQVDDCLCCGSNMVECDLIHNFHHFRYPKDWNNDSWENLIIVCETCHETLHITHDHDSQPKSLRTYILDLLYTSREIHEVGLMDVGQADLWSDCKGRFTITQEGLTDFKTMSFKIDTRDQIMIKFFERMRRSYIDKRDTER